LFYFQSSVYQGKAKAGKRGNSIKGGGLRIRPPVEKGKKMSKKLFVGGLSWGTEENMLRAAFERFGEIEEVKVITDLATGRSRGFGFVTFIDDKAADEAMAEMDGTMLDNRNIKVNEALERKPGGGGRPRRRGYNRDND
jgi:RNA recognition motif-containing protein